MVVFSMKIMTNNGVHDIPITIFQYNTFLKRFKGLMFKIKPIVDKAIILSPCNSIHMFFMFFPIDVVFLDDQNKILYLKEHVKPWTVIFPIKNAKSALELPAGTISTYSIKKGDLIIP
jgi:uncharacterized protein